MTDSLTPVEALRRIYHFMRYVWRVSPTGVGRIDIATAWAIAKAVA